MKSSTVFHHRVEIWGSESNAYNHCGWYLGHIFICLAVWLISQLAHLGYAIFFPQELLLHDSFLDLRGVLKCTTRVSHPVQTPNVRCRHNLHTRYETQTVISFLPLDHWMRPYQIMSFRKAEHGSHSLWFGCVVEVMGLSVFCIKEKWLTDLSEFWKMC